MSEIDDQKRKQDLENNRSAEKTLPNQGANVAQKITRPAIKPLADIPYFLAIGLALLKDLLDLVIQPIPVAGFFLGFVFSLLFGMLIIALLLWADPKNILKNSFILLTGSGLEMILPLINMLPILTASVVGVYILTTLRRKGLDPKSIGALAK
jgi:hypothetical protein